MRLMLIRNISGDRLAVHTVELEKSVSISFCEKKYLAQWQKALCNDIRLFVNLALVGLHPLFCPRRLYTVAQGDGDRDDAQCGGGADQTPQAQRVAARLQHFPSVLVENIIFGGEFGADALVGRDALSLLATKSFVANGFVAPRSRLGGNIIFIAFRHSLPPWDAAKFAASSFEEALSNCMLVRLLLALAA